MSDETDEKKDAEKDSPAEGPTDQAADEAAPEPAAGAPEEGAAQKTEADAGATRRRRRREGGFFSLTTDDEDDDKPKPKPNYLFLIISTAIFLVADLGSKEWAIKRLKPMKRERPVPLPQNYEDFIVVVRDYFHFEYAENRGGAWGIFGDQKDYIRLPFFFLISALAVTFIVSLYRKLEPRQLALKWALPLVLAGALGNLVDRIRHQYVVDFIDWFYVSADGKETHWPTFNVADVWIVAGVLLMFVDMFTPKKKVRRVTRTTDVDKTQQGAESA